MWDQGGQPWPQWPLSQQQWMQSFQHQQDPGQYEIHMHLRCSLSLIRTNLHIHIARTSCIFNRHIFVFCAGQVDWAALAQAWIAQKESTGAEQPNIQPNGQDIPGLEPVAQNNHGAFQGDPAFGRMWQPGICLSTF